MEKARRNELASNEKRLNENLGHDFFTRLNFDEIVRAKILLK